MTAYQKQQEAARQEAIEWQLEAQELDMSCEEIHEAQDYFHKLGRKLGLLKEFRENGIPC